MKVAGAGVQGIVAVVLLQVVPLLCVGKVLEAQTRVLPQVGVKVGGGDADDPVLPGLAESLGVGVPHPAVVAGEEGVVGVVALGVGERVVYARPVEEDVSEVEHLRGSVHVGEKGGPTRLCQLLLPLCKFRIGEGYAPLLRHRHAQAQGG